MPAHTASRHSWQPGLAWPTLIRFCALSRLSPDRFQVYVGPFQRRSERPQDKKFTNVYVKNLNENVNDEKLKEMFAPYGTITSAVVMQDASGKTKCFGFVNFETAEAAQAAVEALEGKEIDGKTLNGVCPRFMLRHHHATERLCARVVALPRFCVARWAPSRQREKCQNVTYCTLPVVGNARERNSGQIRAAAAYPCRPCALAITRVAVRAPRCSRTGPVLTLRDERPSHPSSRSVPRSEEG